MKIIYFLFIFFTTNLFSQKNLIEENIVTPGKYWVNFAIGTCNVEKGKNYYGWSGSLNYLQKNKLFSFRITQSKEFNFFDNPRETVNDAGFLYGFYFPGNNKYASISTGIAFTNGLRRGEFLHNLNKTSTLLYYSTKNWWTIGIPLEMQLFMTHSKYIGFGFTGFANLNTEKSFYGLLFCLQAGKLH